MKYKYIGDKPINFDRQTWQPGDINTVANEKAFLKNKMFELVKDEPKKKFGRKKKSK